MTDGNYIKHWKVLGKLAKAYDDASAFITAQNTLKATTLDQASTGSSDDLPASDLIASYMAPWSAKITNVTSEKAMLVNAGRAYLQLPYFYSGLTTVPDSNDYVSILEALQTEMSGAVDNKTLTSEGSTGLVNFLDACLGAEGTWNTAVDGSANYRDSVYVVSAVV